MTKPCFDMWMWLRVLWRSKDREVKIKWGQGLQYYIITCNYRNYFIIFPLIPGFPFPVNFYFPIRPELSFPSWKSRAFGSLTFPECSNRRAWNNCVLRCPPLKLIVIQILVSLWSYSFFPLHLLSWLDEYQWGRWNMGNHWKGIDGHYT